MDEEVVYSVGFWTVKDGKEEDFLTVWKDFANWTLHNQKGSRNVVMLQDSEQNNRFISFGHGTIWKVYKHGVNNQNLNTPF